MAGMVESCSVCGRSFEVQFRYQMEEQNGGFSFFCSHDCHGKNVRGEVDGGVVCDACGKRFSVELVSQVVRIKGVRKYACAEACRTQLVDEAGGVRLSAFVNSESYGPRGNPAPLGAKGGPVAANAAAPALVTPSLSLEAPNADGTPAMRTPSAPPPSSPGASVLATLPFSEPETNEAEAVATPAQTSGVSTSDVGASRVVSLSNPMRSPAPATMGPGLPPASSAARWTGGARPNPASAQKQAAPKRPFNAPRRLAIFNHKGGTGKTTTSVSIASGLAAEGLRVLLVDTDSQGNVGVSLDVKTERSLYHVLVMGLKVESAAVNVRPNLDLIISNETLAAAELYLAGRQNRDRVLRDRLNAGADAYDVVVLDCSPSLSLMNQNALCFADGIVVPVACDFLSLVGVRQVIKTVKNVNSLLHHPVQIFGVLPTFYDSRARICRDAIDTLKEHFGDRCFAPVRATTKIKEAPAQGKTIYEFAPDSNAAADYRRVVRRLIDGPGAVTDTAPLEADESDESVMATA